MTMSCRAAVAALVVTVLAYGDTDWAERDDYAGFSVSVAATASLSEQHAAQEFAKYWELCTGHAIPVDSDADGRFVVRIGRDGLSSQLLEHLELDGLGPDGLQLRTVGSNLLIVGGRERGTLYGVYEFFQRHMGVRWLAPDCTHIPPAPSALPAIDYRYVPTFTWRDVSYRPFIEKPWFAAVHRLNGQHVKHVPELGGRLAFANGFGHTFHTFVAPSEYGRDHPEYFSEIQGERVIVPKGTQLCLTNPEVLRIVTAKTRKILHASPPDRPFVSITQMDWPFWCECASCKAIDEEEGSHAGSVLWFVNQVAKAIEEEFPKAYIDTFAYTYTRKPPKHIRPRDNVVVRLCSIECDFSRPHSDHSSPYNRAFQQDIKRWTRITKNLFIWDYTQNWFCHQQPQPNFHVLQPNVKFFAEQGVVGLFEQASPTSPHSDFEYLKAYILGHAVWEPSVDWHVLMDEFIALYYREAGPCVHEYIKLITDKVIADEYYLGFLSQLEWMDYETVEKAQEIFRRAFAAVNDDVVRKRLESIYVSVQYAALVCVPRIEFTGDAYVLTRPPSQTFDEYWAMIMDMGVTMLEDRAIVALKKRLDGKTPPRYQRLAIEKLENDTYEVWVLPELSGSIVRFRDKRTGVDLFRGEEAILNGRWRWQDWEVMDPEDPEVEEGIDVPYAVVGRGEGHITLEAAPGSDLVIRRTVRLEAGAGPLDMTFTITNRGTVPIVPRVKSHPEFWLQGASTPQIWIERRGQWKREALNHVGSALVGAGRIEADGLSRCAFHVPRKKLTLMVEPIAEQLDSVFYYFNIPNEHVNLELVPDLSLLAPGASRSIKAAFSISRRSPRRL